MRNSQIILLLLVLLQTSFVAAQKVSTISYRQEQSNIIVTYNLETKTPCKVGLFVSTNGGTTWQGPLTKVTGDVGAKIVSGSHNIIWNVLEEFEELRGDKIQFRVRADGENIETVVIGTQEWTKKNLNVSKYKNGDVIPEVKDPREWAALTTGAWCYYNNDPKNGAIYGKLYNWYAVNDPRGLAPEGFHIPTKDEFDVIYDFKDKKGFTGLPGGSRGDVGSFNFIGNLAYWWSSSETHTPTTWGAWARDLYYNNGDTSIFYYNETSGHSVRCIKD